MTNVSAFKICTSKNKKPQNAVVVADSMVTRSYAGQKDDSSQKLFVLNGALIMYSGSTNAAIRVYEEMRRSQIKGPEAIAKSILDFTARKKMSPQIPLEFIVSGYERDEVGLYYVNATGFNNYNPEKSSSEDKHIEEGGRAFIGSGSPFASRIVDGQIDLGLDPTPRDITSGLSLLTAVAAAATESSGVNDKLQYGVITPTGMHVLFHPTMRSYDFEAHSQYLKGLFGIEIGKYGEFGTKAYIKAREGNRPIWLLARDFYNSFELDLSVLSSASRDFRAICDIYKEGRTSLNGIKEQKEKYQKAKSVADRAVEALLSGSKDNVVEYVRGERERRERQY